MGQHGAPVKLWVARTQLDGTVVMARSRTGHEWIERHLGRQGYDPVALNAELTREHGIGLHGFRDAEEQVLDELVDRMNQLERRRRTQYPFSTPKTGFLSDELNKELP